MNDKQQEQRQTSEDGLLQKLGRIAERFVKEVGETADGAFKDLKDIDFKKEFNNMSEELQSMFGEIFARPDFSETLRGRIRVVKDFPKPGVDFLDIQPLLSDPDAFHMACVAMLGKTDMSKIDAIVAIESRGFLFGTAIASMFDKKLILIRKKGKLPPPVMSESYTTEYSTDTIEMLPGIGRILVVDDVLATGGTLRACLNLCSKAGYQVTGVSVFMDMIHLHPVDVSSIPVNSALKMDGKL
jgi:adenine phosphoribosyltransferase